MSAPVTDLDRPRKLLEEMGFEFAPQVLGELAERAVREKLPQLGLLEMVLGTERERREERRQHEREQRRARDPAGEALPRLAR